MERTKIKLDQFLSGLWILSAPLAVQGTAATLAIRGKKWQISSLVI